jgi:hypothetical protein
LGPFKSLYLALYLPVASRELNEIISFVDSVIHFPTTIAGDDHKNMKIDYVIIYARMIQKLARMNDERVRHFE